MHNNAIVYHVHNCCYYIPVVEYMIIMSASRTPNLLSDRKEDEDFSLETSDLVSLLKGIYAGEIGRFVCYTKAKALVNV